MSSGIVKRRTNQINYISLKVKHQLINYGLCLFYTDCQVMVSEFYGQCVKPCKTVYMQQVLP